MGPTEAPADYMIPDEYSSMRPQEKAEALRTCILLFLQTVARANAKRIFEAIQAPNEETVKKQLHYLATTQHVYMDEVGRDPVYYANGKLAHPQLQRTVKAGFTEFVIRTYSDRLTGRYLTITEYHAQPTGELKPRSGIRVDLADLESLIAQLADLRALVQLKPELLNNTR